jgi:hypothetical protein
LSKNRFNRIKSLLLLLFLVAPVLNLAANNEVTISKINTDITGKTRRSALLRELQIEEGRTYQSIEFLTAVVDLRVEQLLRRRLFNEFSLDITPVESGDIEITIVLVDSFTILPRPMVKYSSSQGLTLGLKIDYFNAFGTLSDHMAQGYWSPTEILFEYRVESIPVGPIHLGADFQQFMGLTRYGNPEGELVAEYSTSSSTLTVTMETPLGLSSPWNLKLIPLISWIYNPELNFNNTGYPDSIFEKYGFTPGLNVEIETDQTNWVGNFRKGFYYDFTSSNLWYTDTGFADNFLDSDLVGFLPINSWFALTGRIAGFYAINGIREDAGDRLRGVLDYMTYGHYGAYLNLQTEFKLFTTRKGISMHLGPFTDIGYVYSQEWDQGPESWEYCAGLTATFFLEAMPSLVIAVNYGYDFKRGASEIIFDTVQFF